MNTPDGDGWIPGPSAPEVMRGITLGGTDNRVLSVGERELALHGTEEDIEAQASSWLYSTLHTRNPHPGSTTGPIMPDYEFTTRLASLVPDPTIRVPVSGNFEGKSTGDGPGTAVVALHGLRVAVPVDRIETADGHAWVRMSAYRPNLTPGFLMVVCERPSANRPPGSTLWRHYIPGSDSGSAMAVWQVALPRLIGRGLSFRAKILSHQDMYPRADAIVVYSSSDAAAVQSTLVDAMTIVRELFVDPAGRSRYCEQHETGLARAVSPQAAIGGREESFGQHRSAAIARAVASVVAGARRSLLDTIASELESSGIDKANIARNAPAVRAPVAL